MDAAHQAALAEHRMRLDEPQLAEDRHRTGGRRGAHGEQLRADQARKVGVAGGEERRLALALHLAQLAVHLRQAVVARRHVGQDALVQPRILAVEQQMDGCRLAVAPRAAAHLVELDLVKRHVIEHHMADVGDVHALAERARGHQHRKRVGAEQILDALALAAREARVVETDERGHLRGVFAQVASHRDGLFARIDEHDGLLPRRHEVRQVVVARRHVAAIVEREVGPVGAVVDAHVDGQLAPDGVDAFVVGRGGEREHRGVAQAGHGLADGGVGLTLAGTRQADVVRLVDDDELHALGEGERIGVPRQKLRGGQGNVHAAVLQPSERAAAFVNGAFARERDHGDAEARKGFPQVKRLVGDERAQRVDEQAGLAAGQGAQGCMHLEGERLAAARHHDAEHRFVGIEVVQDELLRVVKRGVADDGAHHFAGKLLRVGARKVLPLDAVALEHVLVLLDGLRVVRGVGAQHVVLRGVQVGHEA